MSLLSSIAKSSVHPYSLGQAPLFSRTLTSSQKRNFTPHAVNNLRCEKPLRSVETVYNMWAPNLRQGIDIDFNKHIRLLDCTWNLQHEGHQLYQKEHIPLAQWFDIDAISQKDTSLPHMLPSDETFIEAMKNFGITNDTVVLLYDRGIGAARVWWTMKAFGHDHVYIMNGGLPQWKAKGRPTTNTDNPSHKNQKQETKETYKIKRRKNMVYTYDQVIQNVVEKKDTPGHTILLDARAQERFEGKVPDPRPGVPSGHIPGSKNLPFSKVYDQTTGLFLPVEKMEAEIQAVLKGETSKSIVLSCGSGITACILEVALAECGYYNNFHYPHHRHHQHEHEKHEIYDISVYDGSWTEFGPKFFSQKSS